MEFRYLERYEKYASEEIDFVIDGTDTKIENPSAEGAARTEQTPPTDDDIGNPKSESEDEELAFSEDEQVLVGQKPGNL
ncbi:Hypothetical protein NTJ_04038 [Nesidiocoris tenuis]|uniref:Uncharacterized protein n=1 Tax=Nesidiocoris tenuis TaxID=355587 RepID=A0ABN7AJ64_9HEMI|nr:Hypothetical protein NTJ_04038 [Nesidiocoris tenuis]